MIININLDNLIEILRKNNNSLYNNEDNEKERFISLLKKLEKNVKNVQNAYKNVDDKSKSFYNQKNIISIV